MNFLINKIKNLSISSGSESTSPNRNNEHNFMKFMENSFKSRENDHSEPNDCPHKSEDSGVPENIEYSSNDNFHECLNFQMTPNVVENNEMLLCEENAGKSNDDEVLEESNFFTKIIESMVDYGIDFQTNDDYENRPSTSNDIPDGLTIPNLHKEENENHENEIISTEEIIISAQPKHIVYENNQIHPEPIETVEPKLPPVPDSINYRSIHFNSELIDKFWKEKTNTNDICDIDENEFISIESYIESTEEKETLKEIQINPEVSDTKSDCIDINTNQDKKVVSALTELKDTNEKILSYTPISLKMIIENTILDSDKNNENNSNEHPSQSCMNICDVLDETKDKQKIKFDNHNILFNTVEDLNTSHLTEEIFKPLSYNYAIHEEYKNDECDSLNNIKEMVQNENMDSVINLEEKSNLQLPCNVEEIVESVEKIKENELNAILEFCTTDTNDEHKLSNENQGNNLTINDEGFNKEQNSVISLNEIIENQPKTIDEVSNITIDPIAAVTQLPDDEDKNDSLGSDIHDEKNEKNALNTMTKLTNSCNEENINNEEECAQNLNSKIVEKIEQATAKEEIIDIIPTPINMAINTPNVYSEELTDMLNIEFKPANKKKPILRSTQLKMKRKTDDKLEIQENENLNKAVDDKVKIENINCNKVNSTTKIINLDELIKVENLDINSHEIESEITAETSFQTRNFTPASENSNEKNKKNYTFEDIGLEENQICSNSKTPEKFYNLLDIKGNDTMSIDMLKMETDIKSIDSINKQEFKMAEMDKNLKNEVFRNDDLDQKLKEYELRTENLVKRISEKDKTIAKMSSVVEAYEKAIAELVAEKEQIIQSYEKKFEDVKSSADVSSQHLLSLENTFSDLHAKYERSKQIMLSLKQNEEQLEAQTKQLNECLKTQEQRYEKMKSHAIGQLGIANDTLENLSKQHLMDISKLKAQLKKEEISRQSIHEQLTQKIRENEELVKICDELINGGGS